jgi:hypothetical protein
MDDLCFLHLIKIVCLVAELKKLLFSSEFTSFSIRYKERIILGVIPRIQSIMFRYCHILQCVQYSEQGRSHS